MADFKRFCACFKTYLGRTLLPVKDPKDMTQEQQYIAKDWLPFVQTVTDNELENLFSEVDNIIKHQKYANLSIPLFRRALKQLRVGDVFERQTPVDLPEDCACCSDGMMLVPFIYVKGKAIIGFERPGHSVEHIETCDIPCKCKRGEYENRYMAKVGYNFAPSFREHAYRFMQELLTDMNQTITELSDEDRKAKGLILGGTRVTHSSPKDVRLMVDCMVGKMNGGVGWPAWHNAPQINRNPPRFNANTQTHTITPPEPEAPLKSPENASNNTEKVTIKDLKEEFRESRNVNVKKNKPVKKLIEEGDMPW